MAIALRFISGKYTGGEIPLEEERELIVGRSGDLGIILVDEMVSRRHAKLVLRERKVHIEDLDSTNGIFVNGQRVQAASVNVGDRINIGGSILHVVDLGVKASPKPFREAELAAPTRRIVHRPAGSISGEIRMSGNLEEIPLPDLLQLLGTSKKDGVLWIDNRENVGRIVLHQGRIQFAQIESQTLGSLKAVYRMLGWPRGVFELDPPSDQTHPEAIDEDVQSVLLEAFRQKDELSRFQARLPARNAKVALPVPLKVNLKDLTPKELELLQLMLGKDNVGEALDTSPLSDLESAETFVKLIDKGYLCVTTE